MNMEEYFKMLQKMAAHNSDDASDDSPTNGHSNHNHAKPKETDADTTPGIINPS